MNFNQALPSQPQLLNKIKLEKNGARILFCPPPPHFYIFSKKTLFIAYLRDDKYFKYNLFFAIEKCINSEFPDLFQFFPPFPPP